MKVDVPRMLNALRIRDASFRWNEWWATCPYPDHDDKDPSWSIHDNPTAPNHGFHKCFGCKRGGGPIELVSARIGITRSSAARWLRENGLILGQAMGGVSELKVVVSGQRLRPKLPPSVVVEPLEEWPGLAREYAMARGIGPQHVLRYRLGYAIHGRLAGRIVFPAWDVNGDVTNYTARAFSSNQRRYMNPDKKEGYPHQSSVFGEHLWPSLPRDVVFTTEGAINGLAVDSALAGHYAIGALFGSQLHPPQVLKLTRFTTIIHIADPDVTGHEFARKIRDALKQAADVRVVYLAEGDAQETPQRMLKEALHAEL